jgi:CDP-diacylglycerol pyrophosphatase
LLETLARRPLRREEVGLVVNSEIGRSQDQLHIHIDCVRADVSAALLAHQTELGPDWRAFPVALAGKRYVGRWLAEDDLASNDPFKLVAALPGRKEMSLQTVALIGATSASGQPGFVLLDHEAMSEPEDTGHAEDLLDLTCQAP